MDVQGFTRVVEERLAAVADDGSPDQVQWFHQVLDVIRQLATDYKSVLPSRDVFLAALGAGLDRIFAGVNTPGPDMVVEPMIKMAVLAIAGRFYDRAVAG